MSLTNSTPSQHCSHRTALCTLGNDTIHRCSALETHRCKHSERHLPICVLRTDIALANTELNCTHTFCIRTQNLYYTKGFHARTLRSSLHTQMWIRTHGFEIHICKYFCCNNIPIMRVHWSELNQSDRAEWVWGESVWAESVWVELVRAEFVSPSLTGWSTLSELNEWKLNEPKLNESELNHSELYESVSLPAW